MLQLLRRWQRTDLGRIVCETGAMVFICNCVFRLFLRAEGKNNEGVDFVFHAALELNSTLCKTHQKSGLES